jgi:hypothetical protein
LPFAVVLVAVVIVVALAAVLASGSGDTTPHNATSDGTQDERLAEPVGGDTTDETPRFAGSTGEAAGAGEKVTVRVYRGAEASGRPIRSTSIIPDEDGDWSLEDGKALKPGVYTARATSAGVSSSPVTFSVQASKPDEDDPSLLAAGDIASCGSSQGDEETAALLGKLKGEIQTIGDNAYEHGTKAEFECFDSSWGRHKSRIHPALGDHEYDTGTAQAYFDYFGRAAGEPGKGWYSYDLGDWHIVVINPNCLRIKGGCEEGGEQETWLRNDLDINTRDCTLAVVGGPLFSSGAVHGSESSYKDLWETLYARNADVILSADDHVYERFAPQTPDGKSDLERGIRQFTVGTGGYFLYKFGPPIALSEERHTGTHGVLQLALHSGSYEWRFQPVAGSAYTDRGSAYCH